MSDKTLSVLDMAKSYADENNFNVEEFFKKNPVSGNIKKEAEEKEKKPVVNEQPRPKSKETWKPPEELTRGMDELNNKPVTYKQDEIKNDGPNELLNGADEELTQESYEAMDEMGRKYANIEKIKAKYGIKNLQVPEGPYQVKILAAAGDIYHKKAIEKLTEIFDEMINIHPEFILEWNNPKDKNQELDFISPEANNVELNKPLPDNISPKSTITPNINKEENIDTKVIINKTDLPEIAWSKEDMDKIRKSRSIELNIVEDINLKYTNIEEADDNAIDSVLSQYTRKFNDIVGVLPASKYRATFIGVSYPYLFDLTHSQELATIDGEKKKWSIVYEHIKNPSIGQFIDFEDFLKKTSYLNLNFILWKILCATAMEKEIITIDCNGKPGAPCDKSYDWIYSPRELLLMNTVNPVIAEEMKITGEASSAEEIHKNYMSSMLNLNNVIELPTSKFGVIFGHISAYEYLEHVYPKILSTLDENNKDLMPSQAYSYYLLKVIKGFILPKEDGSYLKVSDNDNMIKIMNTLNEIDFQTLLQLVTIMEDPYKFKFVLRDIYCPHCKQKSEIPIGDMTRLLFIVAQSLSSVQVVLKKH